MWGCSHRVSTLLGGDEALAWDAHEKPYALLTSGAAFPFVLERLSSPPARPQEASPYLSRGRPCGSNRWGNAHSGCPRCLAAMRLWHGALLGVRYALRTSGVALPFVLERLSSPTARPQEASPHGRFELWEAVGEQPMGAR